jgi:hypothetical protein
MKTKIRGGWRLNSFAALEWISRTTLTWSRKRPLISNSMISFMEPVTTSIKSNSSISRKGLRKLREKRILRSYKIYKLMVLDLILLSIPCLLRLNHPKRQWLWIQFKIPRKLSSSYPLDCFNSMLRSTWHHPSTPIERQGKTEAIRAGPSQHLDLVAYNLPRDTTLIWVERGRSKVLLLMLITCLKLCKGNSFL